MPTEADDATLIDAVTDRLTGHLQSNDPPAVRDTVREEVESLRRTARVQTYVPILAERRALQRLRGGRGRR